MVRLTIFALLAAAVAAVALRPDWVPEGLARGPADAAPVWRLGEVTRGDVVRTVSASGTVRAVVTVNVGAEVSGMVATLAADFNSEVRAGQVIARIDPAPFEARLAQAAAERDVARASLAAEEAALAEIQAGLAGVEAVLELARTELARQQSLLARGSATERAAEGAIAAEAEARAAVNAVRARIARQRAGIELATAEVARREAAVRLREIEMENTLIRSPVDGVVVQRNVDAGQIIAASLEAPVLFQIAQDLARMQLNIQVDEADIGRIRVGQRVSFTVDAYPARRFEGEVSQVRKAGLSLSSVVTYTVVATFENPELLLLPGMTADAQIVTERREDVLRVPTAAFYFSPPGVPRGAEWRVWTPGPDGAPLPRPVEFGIYDESQTEIVAGLDKGDRVIVALEPQPERERRGWLSAFLP